MNPREVAEHQRSRMYGAMVEAVAANGYGRTSVKQVVALAGVSRRAFYEQFANKQECFLATLDRIVRRTLEEISDAYLSTEGGFEERMRAALTACVETVAHDPKSAHVLMIDAPSAGPAGWARPTKMLVSLEGLLAASFARSADTAPLPTPVVRGIVGGLRRIVLVRLRGGRTDELRELVEPMLSWVLVFKTSEPGQLAGLARRTLHGCGQPLGRDNVAVTRRGQPGDARATAHGNAGGTGLGHARPPLRTLTGLSGVLAGDDRTRLLETALELAELEGYGNVAPLRIADEAGVSIDVFFELFEDMQVCFLVAIDEVGEQLRRALVDPELTAGEWPTTVRRSLDALMRRLAAHPAHAHAIATGAFTMGECAVESTTELARDIAAALIEDAPGPARGELTREGIEGAIWHTIYHQAMNGRTELLPKLSGYLAYVVLAPFLGAKEAARMLTEDLPACAGVL